MDKRVAPCPCGVFDAGMKPIADATLYGIIDLGYVSAMDVPRVAREMIAGGVDLLQLRAKGTDEVTIEEIARELVEVSEPAGIPLMINDFPQIVPSLGAQGAHVGQDDFAVEDARWRAGRSLDVELPPVLIGKSTHSVEQAVAAQAAGADYIGFGPLFATPTKPGRPAIGLSEIRRVHELVTIPIFCIGGIKLENLQEVIDAGARRVVIVSGILTAADIPAYCRKAKALLGARL